MEAWIDCVQVTTTLNHTLENFGNFLKTSITGSSFISKCKIWIEKNFRKRNNERWEKSSRSKKDTLFGGNVKQLGNERNSDRERERERN